MSARSAGDRGAGRPPAPFHATPGGWAGPDLLATTVFEKHGRHQPLNCYEREGFDVDLSKVAGQFGLCTEAPRPLHDPIADHVGQPSGCTTARTRRRCCSATRGTAAASTRSNT